MQVGGSTGWRMQVGGSTMHSLHAPCSCSSSSPSSSSSSSVSSSTSPSSSANESSQMMGAQAHRRASWPGAAMHASQACVELRVRLHVLTLAAFRHRKDLVQPAAAAAGVAAAAATAAAAAAIAVALKA